MKIRKIEKRKGSKDVIQRAMAAWAFRRRRKHAATVIESAYLNYKQPGIEEEEKEEIVLDRKALKVESIRIVEQARMRAEDADSPQDCPSRLPSPIEAHAKATKSVSFDFKEQVPKTNGSCVIS
jgi:hypothetical protein